MGRRVVAEAIRAGMAIEVRVASGVKATPDLRDALRQAEAAGVPVTPADRRFLASVGPDHHGIAARIRPPGALTERELSGHRFGSEDVVVVLDGISDPQNLGAAARCAEAAGAAMLVLRGRRAAGATSAAIRASSGALLHVPVARVANLRRAVERLKDVGFTVVGLDGAASATVFDRPCPGGPVAIVIGAEGTGLSRLVREACDELVALPMRGSVGSLNASAALAAALYAYVLPSRTSATG